MSRTEAAGKRNWKTGKVLEPGLVSPKMMQDWVREKGVILRGGGLDESPHACGMRKGAFRTPQPPSRLVT